MLKRTLSGAVYVLILLGAFLLRQLVDYRLFLILLYFFSLVSSIELSTATEKFGDKGGKVIAVIFGVLFMPCFFLFEFFGNAGLISVLALIFLFSLITFIIGFVQESSIKRTIVSCLNYVYPAFFILCMALLNEMEFRGFIGLLLVFTISPFTDVFAYLVGMTYSKIKKGKVKKLAPNLSPNKTVAGAIGGLIGGVVASLIVSLIYIEYLPVIHAIILGVIGSVMNQLGDLFESFIKRKCEIKDMGNLMPGHGGVLDRIDGTSFCAFVVYIYFLIFIV